MYIPKSRDLEPLGSSGFRVWGPGMLGKGLTKGDTGYFIGAETHSGMELRRVAVELY